MVAALITVAIAIAVRRLSKEVSVLALLRQKPKVIAPATLVAAVLTEHIAEI